MSPPGFIHLKNTRVGKKIKKKNLVTLTQYRSCFKSACVLQCPGFGVGHKRGLLWQWGTRRNKEKVPGQGRRHQDLLLLGKVPGPRGLAELLVMMLCMVGPQPQELIPHPR